MPFSDEAADRAVRFMETHIVHVTGEWAGQPFRPEPWQLDFVRDIFGTLNPDGTRQYRTAFLGVGRKNGKSFLGAAIALKLLLSDNEPGAEIYSAAADRDQARLVFGMARKMVEASPALTARTKLYQNAIIVPATGATYRVLSAEAYSKHGLSPHGVIFDELHAQADRELWDVLTTGQGARRQPLTLAITTAGFDQQTICHELYRYGQQLTAGAINDPTFYFRWYGADPDDEWDAESTWRKANPNLGVSVNLDFYRNEARQARNLPARQSTFDRLYNNVWTQASARWIALRDWDATSGLVNEADLRGRRCYGGLDLATTTDIAALCWDFPDEDGGHEAIWRFFVPQERLPDLDARTAGQASVWRRNGFLTVTEGNVIDYHSVLAQIDKDARTFDIAELAYDRWGMTQLSQDLQDAGLTIVPFGQGFSSMSPPTKALESLILSGKYRHGGNPVMRWMIDNVVIQTDASANVKIDKKKSTEKVDGAIAAVMALDRATRHEPPKKKHLVVGF